MSAEGPSYALFRDLAAELGVPEAASVEYDYELTRAIAALARLENKELRLVFTGGTSLRQAHNVIARMSRDADLRVVSEAPIARAQLRALRTQVAEQLREAGFAIDPNNPYHVHSRNLSRYTLLRVPYESRFPGGAAGELQIELVAYPLKARTVERPVSSLLSRVRGDAPEVSAMACSALEEAAADKLVGLTRRVSMTLAPSNAEPDFELVRHIYDLHQIRPHIRIEEASHLAAQVIEHEQAQYRTMSPRFAADPAGEGGRAIDALLHDPSWREAMERYQAKTVYGPPVQHEAAVASVAELGSATWARHHERKTQLDETRTESNSAVPASRTPPRAQIYDRISRAEHVADKTLDAWLKAVRERESPRLNSGAEAGLPVALRAKHEDAEKHRTELLRELRDESASRKPPQPAPLPRDKQQLALHLLDIDRRWAKAQKAWTEFKAERPPRDVLDARRGDGPGATIFKAYEDAREARVDLVAALEQRQARTRDQALERTR